MKTYATIFKAINRTTGEMNTFSGERIHALTFGLAEEYCRQYKPYLKVIGVVLSEIPCKEGSFEPDFKNRKDYKDLSLN